MLVGFGVGGGHVKKMASREGGGHPKNTKERRGDEK